jgi:hypothetical protein
MRSWLGVAVLFLVFLFGLCIFIIRYLFGTYSLSEAYHIFQTIRKLEKKYSSLFDQRDNLLYHIGWAKVDILPLLCAS